MFTNGHRVAGFSQDEADHPQPRRYTASDSTITPSLTSSRPSSSADHLRSKPQTQASTLNMSSRLPTDALPHAPLLPGISSVVPPRHSNTKRVSGSARASTNGTNPSSSDPALPRAATPIHIMGSFPIAASYRSPSVENDLSPLATLGVMAVRSAVKSAPQPKMPPLPTAPELNISLQFVAVSCNFAVGLSILPILCAKRTGAIASVELASANLLE